MDIFKFIGAFGLLVITYGIFVKREINQDKTFIFGGLLLLIYSISIYDPIFISLQIVFILASLYEIFILRKRREKK